MTISKRRSGGRALARLVPGLTDKAFAERGFHEAAVLTDWPAIVGDALADQCAAIQLDHNGTLVVRADGPTATRLQHLEPQILDRIATYFGFRAVKRLTLRQGPVAGRPPAPRTARIDCPEPPAALESELENLPDEALREALLRLGSRIASADEDA